MERTRPLVPISNLVDNASEWETGLQTWFEFIMELHTDILSVHTVMKSICPLIPMVFGDGHLVYPCYYEKHHSLMPIACVGCIKMLSWEITTS